MVYSASVPMELPHNNYPISRIMLLWQNAFVGWHFRGKLIFKAWIILVQIYMEGNSFCMYKENQKPKFNCWMVYWQCKNQWRNIIIKLIIIFSWRFNVNYINIMWWYFYYYIVVKRAECPGRYSNVFNWFFYSINHYHIITSSPS